MKHSYLRHILLCLCLLTGTKAFAYDAKINGIYYSFWGIVAQVIYQNPNLYPLQYIGYEVDDNYYSDYSGAIVIPTSVKYGDVTYSVNSIASHAFQNSRDLVSVTIPESVDTIGYCIFYGCDNLTSVVVKPDNTRFDSRDNCNAIIETATNELRVGCNNTTIPNSVKGIDWYAFAGCNGLASVTIPESVTCIGNFAFAYCKDLSSIKVEKGNTIFDSRDDCNAIIETATNTLIAGCQNTVIPNNVSIGDYAFTYCSGLSSVTIPESVTNIREGWAFAYCKDLTSIRVENGNTRFDSRDNCNAIIETATNTLCVGCKNTVIPNSVTTIGTAAFVGCSGLTSVTIPNGVTSIDDYAFFRCEDLTTIIIPGSMKTIGGCFSECLKLKDVYCCAEMVPNTSVDAFYDGPIFWNYDTNVDYYFLNANREERPHIKYATLHVPASAIEQYKTTAPWSDFGTIVPLTDEEVILIGEDAIEDVKATDEAVEVARYDILGQQMVNGKSSSGEWSRSLNIIRMSDGTTRKVMVK